ncbi:MAG: biopolymer transporter ExbD [Alteromonadaceae bacterium TMED7]|nr:MAG: biopolymer transporter ExbD [Alteromonadaceae bacterium TMED7]|tara:strand:- start:22835 stop:23242 length:408 start_codon:yes stop_codon:yes gene_type:complete
MAMQFTEVGSKRKRAIGVTPLIDIVFILLIFFILETTLEEFKTVDINLPMADVETESASSRQQLLIEVFSEHRLWISGVKIDADQLADHIRSMQPEVTIPVRLAVAENVPLQLLVNVLDVLDESGMDNITVARIE